MQSILQNYPNLDLKAGSVFDLVLDRTLEGQKWGKITGVKLGMFLLYLDTVCMLTMIS